MGQKVNPISNRLGIIRGWDSNWYGGNDYGDALLEDLSLIHIWSRNVVLLLQLFLLLLVGNMREILIK